MGKHNIDYFDRLLEDQDYDEVEAKRKATDKWREIERRREEKELDKVLRDLDWEFDFEDEE